MGERRWGRVGVAILGITALAAGLRFWRLGDIPPGLYHDEAFNGLDALRVLHGERPIYFAANRGREPFFIYLIAVAVNLFGRTPGGLRLAAAVCGTLTIPATFLMARVWFDQQRSDRGIESNQRVALLSAAIMAITLWHVHLSRVGFRAVTLPLVTALVLWFGARAFYVSRPTDWVISGLLYGFTFYTYMPARFMPFVLGAFVLYLLLTGRGDRLWPGGLYFVGSALVLLAPLIIYTVGHWDVVMGRPGQVSVFNPAVNDGDLWGTLGRYLLDTLGMFFVRGDTIPRHNLPGRPVFGPLLGLAMVVGLVQAVLRMRDQDAGSVLALLWVGLMLVPTWLAENAPHFLRAVGVLPLAVIFPALGLDAMQRWLERRGWRGWAAVPIGAILLISLGATGRDYFVRYATAPQTAYAFEDAAAELAAEANRFLGVGWDGHSLAASGQASGERRVYIDKRLWDGWAAIPFLVPETEQLIKVPRHTTPEPMGEALLLIWPHDGVEPYIDALPRGIRVEAHAGPLIKGDLEKAPYPAYVAYAIEPDAERSAAYLARWGDQIALVDYSVTRRDDEWNIDLVWEALESPPEDYTIFVYVYDGGRLAAQHDRKPGDGYYPTNLWRPGDLVVDRHKLVFSGPRTDEAQLAVGMYTWPSLERVPVTAPSGELLGDELELPIASPAD